MTATPIPRDRGTSAASRITLRSDVFDSRTKELGATTDADRAELCGTERTNLYRIRNGQTPSLKLAMHMANRLGLKVEDLFEFEQAS